MKVRGAIDRSRLALVRRSIERRNAVQRALHRDVEVRIDIDSSGGEVFAAMEIGRILREAQASIRVSDGASCVSACVLLLMGAVEREIDAAARIAIHRPSLGASRAPASKANEDEVIAAMSSALAHYAQQMNVPRKIVDDMMSVPSEHLLWLKPSDLIEYGILPLDPVASARS